MEGRYWTAQNFWRGSPVRVKAVVEEALAKSASSIGIPPPHPQFLCEPDSTGTTICEGIVVLSPGADPMVADLAEYARERLADFKVPAHWELRTDPLPRNPAGKVLKAPLRGEHAAVFAVGEESDSAL